jgi:hypothetical protein
MSIFIERYLGRTHAVEGLVKNWKTNHDQNMFVMDVDEMVQECLDLSALCQHAWKTLWQLLRREPNGDTVDEAEDPMKKALAKTLHIFEAVQDLIAQAKDNGFAIQNAEAIAIAAQGVREISAKVDNVYPQMNEVLAEEAIAAFKRGECIPIEELIREAQSANFRAG